MKTSKGFALLTCLIIFYVPQNIASGRPFNLSGFNAVTLSGLIMATIHHGDINQVTLVGDVEDLHQITPVVKNNHLYLEYNAQKKHTRMVAYFYGCLSRSKTVVTERVQQGNIYAIITMASPMLNSLSLKNAANATLNFDLNLPQFLASTADNASAILQSVRARNCATITAAGNSHVHIASLTAPTLTARLTGFAETTCGGNIGDLTLTTQGASKFAGGSQLAAHQATIITQGNSTATVNVTGHLNAKASGSSNIRYAGDPILEKTTLNSAQVVRL